MTDDIETERARAVRERDRNRCQNCQCSAGQVSRMEVHRVVPAESGGSDALTNHVLLCADCHESAHTDQRQQRN